MTRRPVFFPQAFFSRACCVFATNAGHYGFTIPVTPFCCPVFPFSHNSGGSVTNTLFPQHPRVAVFASGLPPHAKALTYRESNEICSFFGSMTPGYAPFDSWSHFYDFSPTDGALNACCNQSIVLWESPDSRSTVELATAVLQPEAPAGLPAKANAVLMPATIFLVGQCTSTFSVAWQLMEASLLPEWGAVLALCQTEGRGQLRRIWHSPHGNLYVSMRLPKDPVLQGDAASLITGFLLVRAFKALGFALSLKWPNDLLFHDSGKVGGVLLEERNGILLAGIGVNLTKTPDAALLRPCHSTPPAVLPPRSTKNNGDQKSVDMGEGTAGERLAPFALWRLLVSSLILEYTWQAKGKTLSTLFALMNTSEQLLAWQGRTVSLSEGNASFAHGRYVGIGAQGGILLRFDNGETRELFSGSLSLIE